MMILKIKEIIYSIRFFWENLKNKKYLKELDKIEILSDQDTINEIKKGKSIARFGDGEFRWILEKDDTPTFQKNSKELSIRLQDVFKCKNRNLLICIPRNLKDYTNFKATSKWFWRKFVNEYWKEISPIIDNNRIYGNTNISRFYMDYKNTTIALNKLNNLKSIWEGRNLLIVEGKDTKLGVKNDLLDNANSVKRIICPSKNSFERYDEILEKIKEYYKKDDLILIALGPTATILASDLSKMNYQAIDIGHIDVEYEWFKIGAKEKIAIEGKYVNEAINKNFLKEKKIENKKYNLEIIYKFN